MSNVEPIPWDGKCPHCGEEKRVYPTGGSIGHMGPGPSNKVMICTKCNKHFYLTEKTETTIFVSTDPI